MPDLLSGVALFAERVEQGVFRVVSDGVRDLSRPVAGASDGPQAFYRTNVVTGLDGSVWVVGHDDFFRVGDEHSYPVGRETRSRQGQKVKVTPDGVLWTINGGHLVSFTDGTWTVRKEGVTAFDMQPDGTVWATDGSTLERFDGTGWVEVGDVGGDAGPRVRDLWVSPVVHDFFAQSYERPDAEVEVLLLMDEDEGCPGCELWLGFPRPVVAATARLAHCRSDSGRWTWVSMVTTGSTNRPWFRSPVRAWPTARRRPCPLPTSCTSRVDRRPSIPAMRAFR